MRRAMYVAVLLIVSSLTTSAALAKGNRGERDLAPLGPETGHWAQPGDTVTFWCVDLNWIWKVSEPVVTGALNFTGGDPTVSPWCGDPNARTDGRFPVAVPAGAPFMPGGTFNWWTNKTYPRNFAAAVKAQGLGYTWAPASTSPAEDFLAKMSNVRVEIYTMEDELVSEFNFDPQQWFKRIQAGDLYFGQQALGPAVDPSLGIDLTAAEVGRLPLFNFTVLPTAPQAPGDYYYAVYWTLSGYHWDGLGVDPGYNLLTPGEFFYGSNRFRVP